ncbi:MAG: two-component system phosphate regulon sensor histidine kinase PhoR [Paraglaciecola psychrophila]
MFQSKLFWRLYLGYVATILICTIIVGVMVSRLVSENETRGVYQSLTVRAELLAELSRNSLTGWHPGIDSSALRQSIVELGIKTQSRLTVMTAAGIVIADSQELPENMDNHAQRPEIIQARDSAVASASRYSQTLQQKMIYRAQRVSQQQLLLGFVRVSLPVSTVDDKLAELRLIIVFAAAVAAAVALLLGLYIAKIFIDPLTKMTEIAEAISRGDYEKRIIINQQDEIGTLGEAFNRMAKSSALRMAEITTERNRLAMIITGMTEGVIAVDQQQKIIHINHAAAKLLRLSMTHSINQPIWEQVRITEINEALEQAINSRDIIKTQMRRPSDGEDQVVEIYAAVLFDENGSYHRGKLSGAIIVFNDISELDRLERVRRDFVANASHELKTPITAIRGIAETILGDEHMDGAVRHGFVDRINTQSKRLSALVSDLMALSRLESAQNATAFHALDLAELTAQSIAAVESNCAEKGLTISAELVDAGRLTVAGEEQAMSQLIDNLLSNAIEYTPAGGSIEVSLRQAEGCAELLIADSGIGISQQYQQRIFERFYRVDKARSRELGGTGLGLSIVKNIVEQHGGSIKLESQPGVGSSFLVSLPLV